MVVADNIMVSTITAHVLPLTQPVFTVLILVAASHMLWNTNTLQLPRIPRNVSVYRMRPVNYTKDLREDFFGVNSTHNWTYRDAQLVNVGCLGCYNDTLAVLKGEPTEPGVGFSINISVVPVQMSNVTTINTNVTQGTRPAVCACIDGIDSGRAWEDVENETRLCLAQNMNVYRVHATNTVDAPLWMAVAATLLSAGIGVNFIQHTSYMPDSYSKWGGIAFVVVITGFISILIFMDVLPESTDDYNSPKGTTYLEAWMVFGVAACVFFWWAARCVTSVAHTSNFRAYHEDVWFVLGFAVLGTALKLSSGDQDEERLLAIFAIIAGIGALQHLSNVVKCYYEHLSGNLDRGLIVKLTGYELDGDKREQQKLIEYNRVQDSKVEKARSVLQFFGWTRLIIFGLVVLLALTLLTLSDSSNLDMNALQHFMEIHYNIFVVAFVVSIVGVDVFFETVPFMFRDQKHGHIRNIIVCVYVLYVYASVYAWSLKSGLPET